MYWEFDPLQQPVIKQDDTTLVWTFKDGSGLRIKIFGNNLGFTEYNSVKIPTTGTVYRYEILEF